MPLTSKRTHAIFNHSDKDEQARVNFEIWQAVFQKELGPPPNDGIQAPCCASLVVRREAILAHPKIF